MDKEFADLGGAVPPDYLTLHKITL